MCGTTTQERLNTMARETTCDINSSSLYSYHPTVIMQIKRGRVQEVFMEASEVIVRSLTQSREYLNRALEELTQEEAAWSPSGECNCIAFILWHMTRVEDFFVNRVIKREGELYEAEGWQEKLGTPAKGTGYQYSAEELQAWPVPKLEVLQEYASSVRGKTLSILNSISAEGLSEVPRPERSPDSIGAILTRVSTEIALHVGQISYLRGVKRGLDN